MNGKSRKASKRNKGKHGHHQGNDDPFAIIDDNSPIVKPAIPTLIKAYADQREHEITLEAYLEKVYADYKPDPNKHIDPMDEEDDLGPVEYKLKLCSPDEERLIRLTTQMNFRIQEGNGEAKYIIGVQDDGTPTGLNHEQMLLSLKNLCIMAGNLKVDLIILQMRDGIEGKTAEVLVRSNQKDGIKLDIKVMMLGDKQSGKSTLIGVLTSGRNDNGNGSARMQVHVHKHDLLSGQTSSLSHHILGFDSQGKVTNYSEYGNNTWDEIVDASTKIFTIMDIGGHEKYTMRTINYLCTLYPDYTVIVISAVQGVTQITESHIKLALTFDIPIVVVITHMDAVKTKKDEIPEKVHDIIDNLKKFFKKYCSDEKYCSVCIVRDEEDNVTFSRNLKLKLTTPVFLTSCVSGEGLSLLTGFLNLLPVNNPLIPNIELNTEFCVHTTFNKTGQIILGGTVTCGIIRKCQILQLGPDDEGKFRDVEVKTIQCNKVGVKSAYCGQSCSVEIKPGTSAAKWIEENKEKDNNCIKRGMVLVEKKSEPKAALAFSAEISLFENKIHPCILTENYEPVIRSQTTSQPCTLDFSRIDPSLIQQEDDLVSKAQPKQNQKQNENDEEYKELDAVPLFKQKSKSQDTKFMHKALEKAESPNLKKLPKAVRKMTDINAKDLEKASKSNENSTENLKLIANKKMMKFDEKIKLEKMSIYAEANKRKKNLKFVRLMPERPHVLTFKFKHRGEYIKPGQKIFIKDDTMNAFGIIKEVFYCTETNK